MKTYLVTGGAGFIGSNFVLYMLEKYEDITHCQRGQADLCGQSGKPQEPWSGDPRHVFVQADICDREAITRAVRSSTTWILWSTLRPRAMWTAASRTRRSLSRPMWSGTVNMLQCAKNAWAEGDG